ncbi:MAG: hypothetical protein WCG65_07680 [Actinomycetes bacterium]
MRKSTVRVAAAVFALGLFAAACGSDSDSSATEDTVATEDTMATSDTAAPAVDEVAAAKEAAAKAVTIPENIALTVAASATPPTGKKVAWISCELPSCPEVGEDWPAIAKLLGWELKVINVKSFEPAPGIQQALDWGANYIAISGSPIALYQAQFDAGIAKGVKFTSAYTTDKPQGVDGGIQGLLTTVGDASYVEMAMKSFAPWIIADSNAAANVVMVNIRDFPVLVSEEEAMKAGLAAGCAKCTFDVIPVTIEDLGAGKVPQAVASYLQEHKDVNYVHFAFGGLPTGVSAALKTAGITNVKLVGGDFSAPNLQEVVDGTHSAWTSNPKAEASWVMAHAMVLDSLGDTYTEERTGAELQTFIVDTPEAAKAILDGGGLQNWKGPKTQADQFKALWNIK